MNLLAILDARLDSLESTVLHRFLERQRSEHPTHGGELHRYLLLLWAWQAWQDRRAYARDPRAWEAEHPRPTRVLDWRAVALEEAHAWLETQLPGFQEGPEAWRQDPRHVVAARMEVAEPFLEHLPQYFDPARIPWITSCPPALEVHQDLASLLDTPELAELAKDATFQVAFNVKERRAHGRRILGSVKPLPQVARLEWPTWPPPLFRLQLDWQYWATMGSWAGPRGRRELRYRLLHHELMHCRIEYDELERPKAKTQAHGLEEHAATAERYGARTLAEALHYERALAHPRTQALLEQVPPGGRSALVAPPDPDRPASSRIGRMTLVAWRQEILELRERVGDAQGSTGEADLGAAPWPEIEAQLEALAASEPTPEGQLQLEICANLVSRWAPRRLR